MIPVFDGEDYGMWKKRITMFLSYKGCDTDITRAIQILQTGIKMI